GEAVEGVDLSTLVVGLWLCSKVIFEILPIIASLEIGAERATGIVATVDHAIFAARVAGDSIYDAVFVPVHFLEHFPITGIMSIGHQVTWSFPAFDVTGRDRPG